LGHVTRKIISEMTYNVSSGTINPTIQVTGIYVGTTCPQAYMIMEQPGR